MLHRILVILMESFASVKKPTRDRLKVKKNNKTIAENEKIYEIRTGVSGVSGGSLCSIQACPRLA